MTTSDVTDTDLPTLIRQGNHLGVLRHIRIFELHEPELVLNHGRAYLGNDWKKRPDTAIIRRAALEQVALAALDLNDLTTASQCLNRLKESEGVPVESSVRFRHLAARCLEAAGDIKGAELMYTAELAKETPANTVVPKRQYAMLKSQVGQTVAAHAQLTDYLTKYPDDAAAWYELAQLRKELGDFKAVIYCLEQALLASSPLDAALHVELAEAYATAATAAVTTSKHPHPSSLEQLYSPLRLLQEARLHMAQALELDATCTRAQWGLLTCSNLYLEYAENSSAAAAAAADPFQEQVAQALLEHAAAALVQTYRKTPMEAAVKKLTQEYLADGDHI